jgi:small multidrug resistance pump
MSWVYLTLAIVIEVAGSTSMKFSVGMTKLIPSIAMFICIGVSLAFGALATKTMDLSVAYSIWSGLGTALTAAIGIYWFKEPATSMKMVSIALIILGVIGINKT